MIRHRVFLSLLAAEAFALAALAGFSVLGEPRRAHEREGNRQLVSSLRLTDLAVFTEARYTRHPSQADFFSAFQDAPGALEFFPSGSVVAPPRRGGAGL